MKIAPTKQQDQILNNLVKEECTRYTNVYAELPLLDHDFPFRTIEGGYTIERAITADEIINAAKHILDCRVSRGKKFNNPADCQDYFVMKLAEYEQEVFCVAFLDTKNRIIAEEIVTIGSVKHCAVYPREIMKRALYYNAAAVILAHNHPSGTTDPSQADKEVTAELKQALSYIEVKVLDHIIVAGGRSFSFALETLLL